MRDTAPPAAPPADSDLLRQTSLLRQQNDTLQRAAAEHERQIGALQDLTMHALTALAATRDNETGQHVRRTAFYVKLLAEQLCGHPRFAAALDEQTIDLLFKSAPLHDIGKVGVPDSILLKPGRFDAAEKAIMQDHARFGYETLLAVEREFGGTADFLDCAKQIAYSHHEKWDGSGYPLGLAGAAIPLPARLMALADVYDALISERIYKEPLTPAQAAVVIIEGRGSHFEPDIVDAFVAIQDQFEAVARRQADLL